MPCDGETVMAAGPHPNPWGEAQRRTRARSFFAAKRPRGAGLPAGKKGSVRGFRMGDGCHRSLRHKPGIRPSRPKEAGLATERYSPAQAALGQGFDGRNASRILAIQSGLSHRESSSVSHLGRGPSAGYRGEVAAISRPHK